ncbi:hypothetical protein ACE1TI_03015 [Alteribacillus sp. JSM 102045]|uniref:hypothetical protein n=1 Tax=Alteribacillus sp. JSM 102045 TaxID=1562101 RepID=UPI0035C1DFE4
MIKHPYLLWAGISLFSLAYLLQFPFPHRTPFGEAIFRNLGIPPYSNMDTESGLHFFGLASLAALILSLFFIGHSLKKWQGKILFASISIFIITPSAIVSAYQSTMAAGVYAVDYDREKSSCSYEADEEKKEMYIQFSIPLENKSSEEVNVTVEFIESIHRVEDVPTISLLNKEGIQEETLLPKEKDTFHFEETVDISDLEKYYYGGQANGINLILRDSNGNERSL